MHMLRNTALALIGSLGLLLQIFGKITLDVLQKVFFAGIDGALLYKLEVLLE